MSTRMLNTILALAVSVVVAGCGGASTTKPSPVDEQSSAGGTGIETGAVEGSTSSADTRVAMAAQRPDKLRINFEFDSSSIDAEGQALIEAHAAYLAANPKLSVNLEGHADERGTREYNIALGERRAVAVRQLLLLQGVNASQVSIISYGEELPAALAHDEESWGLNRRVELVYEVQ